MKKLSLYQLLVIGVEECASSKHIIYVFMSCINRNGILYCQLMKINDNIILCSLSQVGLV